MTFAGVYADTQKSAGDFRKPAVTQDPAIITRHLT